MVESEILSKSLFIDSWNIFVHFFGIPRESIAILKYSLLKYLIDIYV